MVIKDIFKTFLMMNMQMLVQCKKRVLHHSLGMGIVQRKRYFEHRSCEKN
jgi:hypothetical protein